MAIVWQVFVCAAKDGKGLIVLNLTLTPFDAYLTAPDTEISIYNFNNAFVMSVIRDPTVLKV